MKSKKPQVFVCSVEGEVLSAARSLSRLHSKTPAMQEKSYFYYYRKLAGQDRCLVISGSQTLKINKLCYE